jgi:hypothetical protein
MGRYQIDPSVTSRAQEHPSQHDAARLSPQRYTWEEVTQRWPEMAEHEDAVNWLAHATHDDPEAESRSADDLVFTHKMIDVGKIGRYGGPRMQYPQTSEPYGYRVTHAREGYAEGADVPPVLGIKRNTTTYWADGHHRVRGAMGLANRDNGFSAEIPALIAESKHVGRFPKRDY